MPRYKLIIEYDGAPYAGWQKQVDTLTVQEQIHKAVLKFSGCDTDIVGAGRTDSGVHAIAQAAHVDLAKDYDPFRVMQGINFHLFDQHPANRIAILHAERVAGDFHARFSAIRRHYAYRILNRRARLGLEAGRAWHVIEPLNIEAMREGAKHLLGHQDFTSFRDTQCQAKSPMKTLEKLDIARHGNELRITACARSFLHHQVRNMVGSLSLVGKGKWQPNDIKRALDAKDRTQAGPTAPSDGLYLTGVDY